MALFVLHWKRNFLLFVSRASGSVVYLRRIVCPFDKVFRRPYRCFSLTLKVILSSSDRYNIFTSDWLWIEVCQKAVFGKIDITMTTINKKNLEIDKIRILGDLDLLLKIRHQELKVWCLEITSVRSKKFSMFEFK